VRDPVEFGCDPGRFWCDPGSLLNDPGYHDDAMSDQEVLKNDLE
jgi:hypothetical protein